MEENVLDMPEVFDNITDEDGVPTASQFSVQEWLLYRRRSLLNIKDKLEMSNREEENKKKLMMQDALRSSNRQKIQKLRDRKHFLAWQTDYAKCKESLKQVGLANWRSELLKIAKSSLEIETDVRSTVMVTSLKEFEAYIRNNYMTTLQVMTDLFTDVFNETKRPMNVEQSSSRITDVMNIIRLCPGKGIYSKIS